MLIRPSSESPPDDRDCVVAASVAAPPRFASDNEACEIITPGILRCPARLPAWEDQSNHHTANKSPDSRLNAATKQQEGCCVSEAPRLAFAALIGDGVQQVAAYDAASWIGSDGSGRRTVRTGHGACRRMR